MFKQAVYGEKCFCEKKKDLKTRFGLTPAYGYILYESTYRFKTNFSNQPLIERLNASKQNQNSIDAFKAY